MFDKMEDMFNKRGHGPDKDEAVDPTEKLGKSGLPEELDQIIGKDIEEDSE